MVTKFEDPTLSVQHRLDALTALWQAPRPTPATLGSVARLAEFGDSSELASRALLVLGAMAHGERAGPAGFDVLAGLGRAAVARGRAGFWLEALGNTADPRTAQLAAPWFDHVDPELRARAVRAVRQADGPDARELLLRAVRDPDEMVRVEALVVLCRRGVHRGFAGLADLIAAERDPNVRAAALSELGEQLGGSSAARELIEMIAATDPDPQLREAARRALAGGE